MYDSRVGSWTEGLKVRSALYDSTVKVKGLTTFTLEIKGFQRKNHNV